MGDGGGMDGESGCWPCSSGDPEVQIRLPEIVEPVEIQSVDRETRKGTSGHNNRTARLGPARKTLQILAPR
jgi:hypothetical protein